MRPTKPEVIKAMCDETPLGDACLRRRKAMRAKPEMSPPVPIIASAIRPKRVRPGGTADCTEGCDCRPDAMWSGAASMAEKSAPVGAVDGPAQGWARWGSGLARARAVEPEMVPVSRIPSRERKDGVVSVNVGTSKRVGLR